MTIQVKHSKVSTIPDTDDTSLVRPSDWNADHTLTGLGTMAEQNSNNVNITGGSITGVTGLGDVTGPASATDNAIARFDQTTGKLIQNSVVTVGDTGQIAGVLQEDFTSTTAPAYLEGRVWYDSTEKALAFYNDSSSIAVHVGQDLIVKVINNTGSTIPNGSPVYITSISSGQTYPNVALAKADIAATSAVIGLTNGSIANGAIGYVTSQGIIDNVNTSTFTVGQVLYLSPYSAGQLMNTIPPTGITVQVGVATFINSSTGHIYVKQTTPLAVPASIITGQVAVANGGTGASTASGARTNLGLGTIATQDASAVAITGGTINGTTIGATTASTGRFSDLTDTGLTSGRVTYATTGGNLTDSANLTFNGTTLVANDITDSSLTSGRVTYAGTGGNLRDASNFTYDGTNLVAGAIQNTPIGSTTPSSIVGTTITGQTGVLRGTGQNLVVRSEDFSNASWGKTSVTVTANSTTAPDGTTTADTLAATSADSACFQGVTTSSVGLTYTFSVYLRADSATNISIAFYDTPSYNSTLVACAVTTSWQRFTVTRTLGSGSTGIQATIGGNSTFSTGESVYAWGAQVELGSTANTYIPTTTTAVYGTPTLSFSGVSTLGLESNGALFLQPAGTGAIQAQATTSTTAGGNVRGARAVDWQTERDIASRVASATSSVVSGGSFNTASSQYGVVAGGGVNTTSGFAGVVSGGYNNTASGIYAGVGGGQTNTASGYYGFVGNGFTNSTTSNSAVTTQSGTMNATTAVTLSGSNANIKVGQYITGTSIAGDTYVAAISGTSLTLSKVASGSSTSTLSFFTPHGVVVGGGNNQATGSYSFIGGGGDAGTAANRNVASGDWSVVGGGRNNTASGIGSTIIGGYNPFNTGSTASGVSSVVLGGAGNIASGYYGVASGEVNTASGSYSYAFGSYATTRSISGQISVGIAAGFGSFAQGRSQYGFLGLYAGTTDATPTALRSDANAASGTNQVILPNNSAYFFTGEVVSGVTGGGNTKGWTIEGVIKRGANAASTALVGTPTVTSLYADAGAATWAIAVTADTTNGGLRITFTGQASTTIRTVCKVETTEMTY